EAAAELADAAPWEHMLDRHLLDVEWLEPGADAPRRIYVSVLGAARKVYGISVFADPSMYDVTAESPDASDQADAGALLFATAEELTDAQLDVIAANQWPLYSNDWVPIIRPLAPKDVGTPGPELNRALRIGALAAARMAAVHRSELASVGWSIAPLHL